MWNQHSTPADRELLVRPNTKIGNKEKVKKKGLDLHLDCRLTLKL